MLWLYNRLRFLAPALARAMQGQSAQRQCEMSSASAPWSLGLLAKGEKRYSCTAKFAER